jgi:hypothetical protein
MPSGSLASKSYGRARFIAKYMWAGLPLMGWEWQIQKPGAKLATLPLKPPRFVSEEKTSIQMSSFT